jgi:hypothetical protein
MKSALKDADESVRMALEELKKTVAVTKEHSSLLKDAMHASDKVSFLVPNFLLIVAYQLIIKH